MQPRICSLYSAFRVEKGPNELNLSPKGAECTLRLNAVDETRTALRWNSQNGSFRCGRALSAKARARRTEDIPAKNRAQGIFPTSNPFQLPVCSPPKISIFSCAPMPPIGIENRHWLDPTLRSLDAFNPANVRIAHTIECSRKAGA